MHVKWTPQMESTLRNAVPGQMERHHAGAPARRRNLSSAEFEYRPGFNEPLEISDPEMRRMQ